VSPGHGQLGPVAVRLLRIPCLGEENWQKRPGSTPAEIQGLMEVGNLEDLDPPFVSRDPSKNVIYLTL